MACNRKKPAKIVLSDYTPAMLDVAKERLEEGRTAAFRLSLRSWTGKTSLMKTRALTSSPCPTAFRNMPKREQALSEMYRVLKPGGALCVLEFSTPPNPLMRLGYRFYLRFGIPLWGKICTGDASGFIYLAKSIKLFRIRKLCADAA
mgnify:CR=1 FL=1